MKIVAAAILYEGKVWTLPAPKRHHHIIKHIHMTLNLKSAVAGETQGFLTDDGTFVDRIVAGRIALTAGQIKNLSVPPDLYSEDLW